LAFVIALGSLLLVQSAALAADTNDESSLIAVLKSNAGPAEKDAACARLKFIGTARCVPAVAALLTDEQLSHSARYVLESMNPGEAGAALLTALNQTKGPTQIGLINSLAARGDPRAVPALAKLLKSSEPSTVMAAACGLGMIGGPRVIKPLQVLAKNSAGHVHQTAVDALLRCANASLLSGNPSRAHAIFNYLHQQEESDTVRIAAFRGLILASGNNGLALTVEAIKEPAGPDRTAALQCIHELPGTNATRTLAALLPEVGPAVQLALVEGLHQRGDPYASPALAAFATQARPELVPAVLRALGTLGTASHVSLLADYAASPQQVEQATAREALLELHRGPVTETLITQLSRSTPAVQSELVRALGGRGDHAAVPKLFELIERGPESVRTSAYQALALLAEQPDVGPMVRLVLDAKAPTDRERASEALSVACRHIQNRRGTFDAQPLMAGLATGSADARVALMPVCSELVSPKVRLTLRTAIEDTNDKVRTAAIRATCESIDTELLDDLVSLALHARDETTRGLAIDGAVRLTQQEDAPGLSNERRVTALKALLAIGKRPEEKRRVLSGLAEVPGRDALKTVEPALEDQDVHAEASRAALQIALTVPSAQAQDALAVLNKALEGTPDDATRKALEAGIQQIEARADYITDWQLAGPYRQAGKDFHALFETIFPPEVGDAAGANWRFFPPAGDPKRPWVMDLLKALGPQQQAVAYARTWVHCDKDLKAQLEMGADDGVKAWLNDKQVYAVNAARPLQPGSDKVIVEMHSGWNNLVLKITQNDQAWEFCARFRGPDGSHLDGVQCDTSRSSGAQPAPLDTNQPPAILPTAGATQTTNQVKAVRPLAAPARGTNQLLSPVGVTNLPGAAVQVTNQAQVATQPPGGGKK
jgi:HEAT repeat protein